MATIIDTLITDRTRADVDELLALLAAGENPADHKGAYNASDLNRVGEAVNYLLLRLHRIGIDPKSKAVSEQYAFPGDQVDVNPWQEGTGAVSVDNVRMIHPGMRLADLGSVYGGVLDVASATLTIDRIGYVFTGAENWRQYWSAPNRCFRLVVSGQQVETVSRRASSHFSNVAVTSGSTAVGYYAYNGTTSAVYIQFRPNLDDIPDLASWKAWLAAQNQAGTPLTCWHTIATPEVRQLTERQMTQAAMQTGEIITTLDPGMMEKTNWSMNEIPTAGQMALYLGSIAGIRRKILAYRPGADLPSSMRKLGFKEANQIESLLSAAEDTVTKVMLSYRGYSGRLTAGVNCLP